MSRRSQSHRLRKGRYSVPGQIYLVTTVTFDRASVFSSLTLGRLLVTELRSAHEQGLVYSLAWVVMPDHLHWLFELRSESLSKVVQRVKQRSATTVNKAAGSKGRLWLDGFHDKAARREDDVLAFARYIVANPVRAGLVGSVKDYPLWDAIWI